MRMEHTISEAVLLAAAIGVAIFFIKRWMDRIEGKIDKIHEQRASWITREECTQTVLRVHSRIDSAITHNSSKAAT